GRRWSSTEKSKQVSAMAALASWIEPQTTGWPPSRSMTCATICAQSESSSKIRLTKDAPDAEDRWVVGSLPPAGTGASVEFMTVGMLGSLSAFGALVRRDNKNRTNTTPGPVGSALWSRYGPVAHLRALLQLAKLVRQP